MVGTKRAGDSDPSPRPSKLRRVGSGMMDVSDAMALLSGAAAEYNVHKDEYEPVVFLSASAEAVSSFDWSGLVGVLDDEERMNVIRAADDGLLVSVPGAVRRIPISRRLILKEIVSHLGLKVFGYGIAVESRHVVRGWVEMETPSSRVSSVGGRQKFYGDEASTRHEAMEGACDAAISYLRSACFVLVEDINYEEVKSVQKRALAAETWSMLLTDALDGGRNNNKAIREAYASFFLEAKGLCKAFSDVFGVGTIGTAGTSSAPSDEKLYYGGPRPPISRAEQFAFGLIDLINRCTDVDVAVDDVVAA